MKTWDMYFVIYERSIFVFVILNDKKSEQLLSCVGCYMAYIDNILRSVLMKCHYLFWCLGGFEYAIKRIAKVTLLGWLLCGLH